MTSQTEHERGIILSFIAPERQNRYLEILAKPKRRNDITASLAHFKHLDMRYAVQIRPPQRRASEILKLLKLKGAPETCYALSEDSELDGKEIQLADALTSIVGRGMGTFLSCIPGKLGYFEDEDQRWILERQHAPQRR
jgi:hypothetical protein